MRNLTRTRSDTGALPFIPVKSEVRLLVAKAFVFCAINNIKS